MPFMDGQVRIFLNNLEEMTTEKARRELFDKFDKNSDGKIPISEVKEIVLAMGINQPTDKKLKHITKQMDQNRDGYIDFKDFCDYCRTNPRYFNDVLPDEGFLHYMYRLNILVIWDCFSSCLDFS